MIAATYEEPKTNARTRTRSTGYVLPLFNGYIKYKNLCNKMQLDAGGLLIKHEFESRGLLEDFNTIVQSKVRVITRCQEALAHHETMRFEKELDALLTELGVVGLKE